MNIFWNKIIYTWVPRISLALLAQLFAFFFLRLYRNSSQEIQSYQNEISNIECKLMAIEIAMSNKESEALLFISKSLISTERNFILKKDESTTHLEQNKIDDKAHKDQLEMLKLVLQPKTITSVDE